MLSHSGLQALNNTMMYIVYIIFLLVDLKFVMIIAVSHTSKG